MLHSALFLSGVMCLSAPGQESVHAEAQFPERWVLGEACRVELRYRGASGGSVIEAWQLTPAALELDGEALGERSNRAPIGLADGDTISLSLDLAPALERGGPYALRLSGSRQAAHALRCFEPVKAELDFLAMEQGELAEHFVLLQTIAGEMLFELWPEVAPDHVRNWLELSNQKFYDGLQFHRVSPSFMIQGGCPNTRSDRRQQWGLGVGPRMLKLELSEKRHEKGVLSMARGEDPNSGSSQFFVITRDSPQLDGKYSAFGKLVTGYDTLARIGNAPGVVRDGTITPDQPQRITKAIVVRELLTAK